MPVCELSPRFTSKQPYNRVPHDVTVRDVRFRMMRLKVTLGSRFVDFRMVISCKCKDDIIYKTLLFLTLYSHFVSSSTFYFTSCSPQTITNINRTDDALKRLHCSSFVYIIKRHFTGDFSLETLILRLQMIETYRSVNVVCLYNTYCSWS
jgi:hypothetical protein